MPKVVNIEPTPNPDALKFIVQRPILRSGARSFRDFAAAVGRRGTPEIVVHLCDGHSSLLPFFLGVCGSQRLNRYHSDVRRAVHLRMRMPTLRLRWSDPEPDDPSAPVDWRCTSLIIATLFLNFSF